MRFSIEVLPRQPFTWRWAIGITPLVVVFGMSANEQVRAFGIYYAIVLVPFLVIAASSGALAVTRYADGKVTGVDLSTLLGQPVTDPIALLNARGYDAVLALVAAQDAATHVRTVPAAGLLVPVDLGAHHVAAGTNYPEHAGEAQVVDGPFLFAKLVEPTGPRAPVAVGDALLDYESSWRGSRSIRWRRTSAVS